MSNVGPKFHFRAGFETTCDGEIHDGFPTLLSKAFLPAVPRHKFVETLFASLDFAGSWELKSCRTGSVRLFDELNHQLKQAVSMVTLPCGGHSFGKAESENTLSTWCQ